MLCENQSNVCKRDIYKQFHVCRHGHYGCYGNVCVIIHFSLSNVQFNLQEQEAHINNYLENSTDALLLLVLDIELDRHFAAV